jgi:group II intron reverse transcriptase/maturase
MLRKDGARGIMRNPIAVLKSLTEKSTDKSYKFQRLYRNLYNPEFYWLAYKNIYANKGSMTAGVDGSTMDNMSEKRVGKIIASLQDRSYQPTPARREYITKKNSKKKRPLGIPGGDDKLIQEVVRLILESIFERNFSKNSHGFRPKRSCHTALLQIHDTFTGTHWFVEGDIQACFDSFDHQVIIELLRRRIEDEPFIQLIWKFLKAGYMEQWEYHPSYDGVPQGSGISPILANIYLSELDDFMECYKADFTVGSSRGRKKTSEYYARKGKVERYKLKCAKEWDNLSESERKLRAKTLKALQREMRKIQPTAAKDEAYKSIQYVRYADDFIIGVIGSREDALRVKADVKRFLAERLKLTLSEEKTKITHTGDRARFLGYDITVSRAQNVTKTKNGRVQRCHSYVVELLVPREKWVGKLLEYKAIRIVLNNNGKERFKALHRGKLINLSDIGILSAYNAEIRGLYNFYSIAIDSWKIGVFANVMEYSMMKTFACKYKTNVNVIKGRYFRDGNFTVEYQTKSGTRQAVFYNSGFKRKLEAIKFADVSTLPQYKKYDRPNSLRSRIRRGLCEMCGQKTDNISLHQVKSLKALKGKTVWELLMIERRRKTLAVCPKCHSEIHP